MSDWLAPAPTFDTGPTLAERAATEPDELEAELVALGRHAYNEAARLLGWPRWAAPKRDHKSGAAPATCQWEQGYCGIFVAGRYCSEHDPYRRRESGRMLGRGA